MESLRVLRWCRDIQIERIRQLVLHERDQQSLSPNGWKEILALLAINEQIRKADNQPHHADFAESSERPVPEELQSSTDGHKKNIKSLDHVDRTLLREASEAMQEIRKQIEKEFSKEKDHDSDAEKNSPGDEKRFDESRSNDESRGPDNIP